jgi:uncharacterized protein YggE
MTRASGTDAPVVSVRGEAIRRFAPDHAVLSVSVEHASATDRAEALRQATATVAALREALDGTPGVREIALSRVGVREATRWKPSGQEQEHSGWLAWISGRVTVDASAAGDVAGVIAAVEADVSGVAWGLDDDGVAARREARLAAVAAAREAAEDFAVAVGYQLGELRVLADPGLSGSAPPAVAFGLARAAAAGAPELDLDPQPVEVSAVVEATYLLV